MPQKNKILKNITCGKICLKAFNLSRRGFYCNFIEPHSANPYFPDFQNILQEYRCL